MTIISTSQTPSEFEENARLVSGDPTWSLDNERPSFPPIDDAINFVKNIDWADVRQRTRKGINNCGLVIAVVGEKVHDFGAFLAQV